MKKLFFLLVLALAPMAIGATPNPIPQIPGYASVQADLNMVNHLAITVFVNGHPENFAVDTGASTTVLDRKRAKADGVKPAPSDSPYGQFAYIKNQALEVGLVDSLRAGTMDFGGGPIMMLDTRRAKFAMLSRTGRKPLVGLLGSDILLHYKAIINCRTRQIFFRTDAKRAVSLAPMLAKMGYTRVPLREEEGHLFTVPFQLNGYEGRFLVDTGAFNTELSSQVAHAAHLAARPTRMYFTDVNGERHVGDVAPVRGLTIGKFTLPTQSMFVVGGISEMLSAAANIKIDGLLGGDVLAPQHGIIDLSSMSLFLK